MWLRFRASAVRPECCSLLKKTQNLNINEWFQVFVTRDSSGRSAIRFKSAFCNLSDCPSYICRIHLPNEIKCLFLSVECNFSSFKNSENNCVNFLILDHQRDSHLPGHHEVLPQSASSQQPREKHFNSNEWTFPIETTQRFTLCTLCAQVYRSVLLRRTPRVHPADENMEVDSVSGGECKLRHTWL